jgi:hypothetical protein
VFLQAFINIPYVWIPNTYNNLVECVEDTHENVVLNFRCTARRTFFVVRISRILVILPSHPICNDKIRPHGYEEYHKILVVCVASEGVKELVHLLRCELIGELRVETYEVTSERKECTEKHCIACEEEEQNRETQDEISGGATYSHWSREGILSLSVVWQPGPPA